jgi:hypothetical protein
LVRSATSPANPKPIPHVQWKSSTRWASLVSGSGFLGNFWSKAALAKTHRSKYPIVKYTSGHTTPSFWRMSAPLVGGRILMEYQEVEYSVVQLTEGSGWRWELNLAKAKANRVSLGSAERWPSKRLDIRSIASSGTGSEATPPFVPSSISESGIGQTNAARSNKAHRSTFWSGYLPVTESSRALA